MKKVLLLVMLAVATATNASAVDVAKSEVFMKCNEERVFNSLTKYLQTDGLQTNELKKVFSTTETQIKLALERGNSETLERAFNYNLSHAKSILSREQYKKFLRVINQSYHNSNLLLAQNNQ